jgi:hypothetical protein
LRRRSIIIELPSDKACRARASSFSSEEVTRSRTVEGKVYRIAISRVATPPHSFKAVTNLCPKPGLPAGGDNRGLSLDFVEDPRLGNRRTYLPGAETAFIVKPK